MPTVEAQTRTTHEYVTWQICLPPPFNHMSRGVSGERVTRVSVKAGDRLISRIRQFYIQIAICRARRINDKLGTIRREWAGQQ